jgi:hypothetical protein
MLVVCVDALTNFWGFMLPILWTETWICVQVKYWKQYVEAYIAANDEETAKQIFSRCLLTCPHINLWWGDSTLYDDLWPHALVCVLGNSFTVTLQTTRVTISTNMFLHSCSGCVSFLSFYLILSPMPCLSDHLLWAPHCHWLCFLCGSLL